MRQYIFDFNQEIAIKNNLQLDELLILDYLIKFFDSGTAVSRNINGKRFCWISYSKLISDLPILGAKDYTIRRMFASLEKKNIIERQVIDGKLYIYIEQYLLYNQAGEANNEEVGKEEMAQLIKLRSEQNCNHNLNTDDKNVTAGKQNCNMIVNYYKNKIRILCDDENVASLNSDKFIYLLKKELKNTLSDIAYDICIKNASVSIITKNLIVISAGTTDILKLNTHGNFEKAVSIVLNNMLEEKKSEKIYLMAG